VKRLPEKFTRNRYQFEQLCRTENTAIYVQHINGRQKAFEVIVIAVADRKPVKLNGRIAWERCEPYDVIRAVNCGARVALPTRPSKTRGRSMSY
jgi:hypothetical protein